MKLEDFELKEELTIAAILILAVLIIFSEIPDKAILLGTALGVLGGVLQGAKENGKRESD